MIKEVYKKKFQVPIVKKWSLFYDLNSITIIKIWGKSGYHERPFTFFFTNFFY